MATVHFPPRAPIELQPSTKRRDAATAGILFMAAFMVTAAMWILLPSPGFGKGYESVAIARNLAQRGAFANPFAVAETGPSAHLPPMFPLFLAALIRLFGFSVEFVLAASVAAMAVHALHAALLPFVSRLFYGQTRPGIYAAMISLPALQFTPQWEALYVADGLMLFCLFTARIFRGDGHGVFYGLTAGVFGGLLILLNPMAIVICVAWLLYLMVQEHAGW